MLTSRINHFFCPFESNGCYHTDRTADTIPLFSNMNNGLAVLDNITIWSRLVDVLEYILDYNWARDLEWLPLHSALVAVSLKLMTRENKVRTSD